MELRDFNIKRPVLKTAFVIIEIVIFQAIQLREIKLRIYDSLSVKLTHIFPKIPSNISNITTDILMLRNPIKQPNNLRHMLPILHKQSTS